MGQNCYDRWLACLASCFVDIVSLKVNTSSMWYIAQIQLRMALCFFLHKPFSQQLFLSCFLSYFYPLIQEGHGWLASGIVVKFVCSIPAAGSLQVGIDLLGYVFLFFMPNIRFISIIPTRGAYIMYVHYNVVLLSVNVQFGNDSLTVL